MSHYSSDITNLLLLQSVDTRVLAAKQSKSILPKQIADLQQQLVLYQKECQKYVGLLSEKDKERLQNEQKFATLKKSLEEAEAKLSQSLNDNAALLMAQQAEQSKNEKLASVIEDQSEELTRLKRDNQWYAANNLKQLKIISDIKNLTHEYPRRIVDNMPTPSDIIEDYERGVAAVGKAFHDHFGKVVPF